MFTPIFLAAVLLLACAIIRFFSILPRDRNSSLPKPHRDYCRLAVFLGSGGHTSEAIALLSALDFTRYSPRTYICSEGDTLSAQKAAALEVIKSAELGSHPSQDASPTTQYNILTIPRARRVHQSLLTTPFTAGRSLLACLYHITILPLITGRIFADVIILNGPGTCCTLCLAAYVNKFFGLRFPRIIYIESFARVRSLSLSGKLLRPFVDRFIVQWPDLLSDGMRGECRGWLV